MSEEMQNFLDSLKERIKGCKEIEVREERVAKAHPQSKIAQKIWNTERGYNTALVVIVSDLHYYGLITKEQKEELLKQTDHPKS